MLACFFKSELMYGYRCVYYLYITVFVLLSLSVRPQMNQRKEDLSSGILHLHLLISYHYKSE